MDEALPKKKPKTFFLRIFGCVVVGFVKSHCILNVTTVKCFFERDIFFKEREESGSKEHSQKKKKINNSELLS